jgi:ankyrin repeat protein
MRDFFFTRGKKMANVSNNLRTIIYCLIFLSIVFTSCETKTEYTVEGLFKAVMDENPKRVEDILDAGIPADSLAPNKDEFNSKEAQMTPLLMAIYTLRSDTIKILLEHGADPNKTGYGGITPLMLAARLSLGSAITLLLDAGADVTMRDANGVQALGIAVSTGSDIDVIELLIQGGSPIDEKQSDGVTPVMEAAVKRHYDALDLLLENGANINTIASDPESTALMALAQKGDIDMAEYIIERGAEVNLCNSDNLRALGVAAAYNHLDMVQLLIEKGAETEFEYCNEGEYVTPLGFASFMGYDDILLCLLKHGANPNFISKDDFFPLILATQEHKTNAIKILFQNGAKIDLHSNSNPRALFYAIESSYYDTLEFLLQSGANPNEKGIISGEMHTPLNLAISKGNQEIISLLRRYGAEE